MRINPKDTLFNYPILKIKRNNANGFERTTLFGQGKRKAFCWLIRMRNELICSSTNTVFGYHQLMFCSILQIKFYPLSCSNFFNVSIATTHAS
jgi:hypothetical protein